LPLMIDSSNCIGFPAGYGSLAAHAGSNTVSR